MVPLDKTKVVVLEDDEGEDDIIMVDSHNNYVETQNEENGLSQHFEHHPSNNSRLTNFMVVEPCAAPAVHLNLTALEKVTHSATEPSSWINSIFRNPNWGSRPLDLSCIGPASDNTKSRSSMGFNSFALSISPTCSRTGTALEPIEIDDCEDSVVISESRTFATPNKPQFSQESSSRHSFPRKQSLRFGFIMLDDDDSDGMETQEIGGPTSSFTRNVKRTRNRNDEVTRNIGEFMMNQQTIELDDMEDIVYHGVNMMPLEDVYLRDGEIRATRKASRSVKPVPRNPIFGDSWKKLERYSHNKLEIMPNKTLELRDGEFARIQCIFQNTTTKEVRMRGTRLQRARDLNGLLEKKLNEVVVFLEIDLDDHRDPAEQAAIDISLENVLRIRNTRFTNQKFPLCRNVDPLMFKDKETILTEGGLTARWKFTARYPSAADRYENKFKEKVLERLQEKECGRLYVISNFDRRFQWRGETVPGGAYQPANSHDEPVSLLDHKSIQPINIENMPVPDNISTVQESENAELNKINTNKTATTYLSPSPGKRKRDQIEKISATPFMNAGLKQKRRRDDQEERIEETREGIVNMELNPEHQEKIRTASVMIDLTSDFTTSSKASSILQTINLLDSDLSTPPNTGSVISRTCATLPVVVRSAGQKLTYGDAFCGAGGSTRGAVMAGLQVKWGFDFDEHACETWKANFPSAECYFKAANEFVQVAELSKNPELMKVDILHLSPPCQFFSPAHTINGVDDEMNTASLFAVAPVIEVSKPRVATLEQTFGIGCPRFRFYFRSLIQMFTALDFSVRWAFVPLAQWGLPQRRQRLIIIASCPGEILPQIPAPTHSESGTQGLQRFVSANTTLSQIPPNAPDHNPADVIFPPNKRMTPWDGDKILPRAMTTSGGQNYHPSGKRDLTLREYAAMQGFPTVHVFRGSYIKKQIGNAVPPVCAKVLFESVKRDLDKADRVVEDAVLID